MYHTMPRFCELKHAVLKLLLCISTLILCTTSITANATAVKTLFTGDSDIAYWDTSSTFPNSVNKGVGGDTCKQVKKKIGKHLNNYELEWVVLVCGENDLWSKSASNTFKDFMTVVNAILDTGAQVIYMGTKPEPGTKKIHDKYREYDALIRAKAKEMAASTTSNQPPPLVMVDVYPVFEKIEKNDPGFLYKNDKLHMNKNGYSYWNTWATTALADDAGSCIRWKDDVCDEESNNGPTSSPAPTPSKESPSVVIGKASVNVCPLGYQKILSERGCEAAMILIGKSKFNGYENEKKWPSKCYFCDNVDDCIDGVWFNEHNTGMARNGARPICALPGWEEDNKCEDDIDWVYTNKRKKEKDCDWVGKKKKSSRCRKKGDDGRKASVACKYSCIGNGSPCYESEA